MILGALALCFLTRWFPKEGFLSSLPWLAFQRNEVSRLPAVKPVPTTPLLCTVLCAGEETVSLAQI